MTQPYRVIFSNVVVSVCNNLSSDVKTLSNFLGEFFFSGGKMRLVREKIR